MQGEPRGGRPAAPQDAIRAVRGRSDRDAGRRGTLQGAPRGPDGRTYRVRLAAYGETDASSVHRRHAAALGRTAGDQAARSRADVAAAQTEGDEEDADPGPPCEGTCVPLRPTDYAFSFPHQVWFGPASEPVACPPEVKNQFVRYKGLVVPPAECPACSCGPSTGSCTPPSSFVAQAAVCNAPPPAAIKASAAAARSRAPGRGPCDEAASGRAAEAKARATRRVAVAKAEADDGPLRRMQERRTGWRPSSRTFPTRNDMRKSSCDEVSS